MGLLAAVAWLRAPGTPRSLTLIPTETLITTESEKYPCGCLSGVLEKLFTLIFYLLVFPSTFIAMVHVKYNYYFFDLWVSFLVFLSMAELKRLITTLLDYMHVSSKQNLRLMRPLKLKVRKFEWQIAASVIRHAFLRYIVLIAHNYTLPVSSPTCRGLQTLWKCEWERQGRPNMCEPWIPPAYWLELV